LVLKPSVVLLANKHMSGCKRFMNSPDLIKATERLYKVFRNYPLKKLSVEYMFTPEEQVEIQRAVESRPLNQLTHHDLDLYAKEAFGWVGDLEDFKHFLPRLLELMTIEWEPEDFISIGIRPVEMLMKLNHAEWLSWPDEERTAIEEYFLIVWASLISEFDEFSNAERYLTAFVIAMPTLTPFLELWLNDSSIASALHLAEYLYYAYQDIVYEKNLGVFWRDHPELEKEMTDWLCLPEVEQKLETAFFQCTDQEQAESLSIAVEQVRLLQH
jgi:hypothetical protein